jgi:hypothetical protein
MFAEALMANETIFDRAAQQGLPILHEARHGSIHGCACRFEQKVVDMCPDAFGTSPAPAWPLSH